MSAHHNIALHCAFYPLMRLLRWFAAAPPLAWQYHGGFQRFKKLHAPNGDKGGVGDKVLGALVALLTKGQCLNHVDAAIAWCTAVVAAGRSQQLLTAASAGKLQKYLREINSIKSSLFLCAKFDAPPAIERGPQAMAEYADMLEPSGLGGLGCNTSSWSEAGNSALKSGDRRGRGLSKPSKSRFDICHLRCHSASSHLLLSSLPPYTLELP